ncbi:G-patch domain-containing protein [Entamoeba marina]
MERIYEIYPERKKKQRGVQKHWVESDSIGMELIKSMGFEGEVTATDGIDFQFEENRGGIGLEQPKNDNGNDSLQAILDRVKSVSPAINASNPKRKKEKKAKKAKKENSGSKVVMPRHFSTRRAREKIAVRSKDELAGVF